MVSVDPRRVYLASPKAVDEARAAGHTVLRGDGSAAPPASGAGAASSALATAEEPSWWYQCTVRGGREGRDLDAVALAAAVEELGAGELLLNCIDSDGACAGFDLVLVKAARPSSHTLAHTDSSFAK